MNQKVKEMMERVRLTEEELEPIYNKCVEDSHINRFASEVAKAQLNKVLKEDLALIDREKTPTRLGDADKEFKAGWKCGQESLFEQNYLPVIPLAEALKEVEG